jgi:hypothetical protein
MEKATSESKTEACMGGAAVNLTVQYIAPIYFFES